MGEKYTEYLIYIMKKNKEGDSSELNLENLRYTNVIDLLDIESQEFLNEISSTSEDEFNELFNEEESEKISKNKESADKNKIEENKNKNISELNDIQGNHKSENANSNQHIKIENEIEGKKDYSSKLFYLFY